jgi:hypothetical protein
VQPPKVHRARCRGASCRACSAGRGLVVVTSAAGNGVAAPRVGASGRCWARSRRSACVQAARPCGWRARQAATGVARLLHVRSCVLRDHRLRCGSSGAVAAETPSAWPALGGGAYSGGEALCCRTTRNSALPQPPGAFNWRRECR